MVLIKKYSYKNKERQNKSWMNKKNDGDEKLKL